MKKPQDETKITEKKKGGRGRLVLPYRKTSLLRVWGYNKGQGERRG